MAYETAGRRWWCDRVVGGSAIGCVQGSCEDNGSPQKVSWPCMKRFAARVAERPLPSCGGYRSGVWLHHSEVLRLELLAGRRWCGHWPISGGGAARIAPVPWFSGDRACSPEAGSLSRQPLAASCLRRVTRPRKVKKPGQAGSLHCQPRSSPDCLFPPADYKPSGFPLTISSSHLSSSSLPLP